MVGRQELIGRLDDLHLSVCREAIGGASRERFLPAAGREGIKEGLRGSSGAKTTYSIGFHALAPAAGPEHFKARAAATAVARRGAAIACGSTAQPPAIECAWRRERVGKHERRIQGQEGKARPLGDAQARGAGTRGQTAEKDEAGRGEKED